MKHCFIYTYLFLCYRTLVLLLILTLERRRGGPRGSVMIVANKMNLKHQEMLELNHFTASEDQLRKCCMI